jgi:hypothetical protein
VTALRDDPSSIVCARRMAYRRRVLNSSTLQRQAAVAGFPLVIAAAAKEMQNLLEHVARHGESAETRETLRYMEDIIRQEYRNHFGCEMGGEVGQ